VALYPKSAWAFADVQRVGHRPYAAYLLSGVMAAGAAFMISLLFRYLFEDAGNLLVALSEPGRFDKAFITTLERWPWLLMTALNTDCDRLCCGQLGDASGIGYAAVAHLRITRAGACFAMFQWIVVQLLAQVTTFGPRWFEEELRLVVTAAVIGACVG